MILQKLKISMEVISVECIGFVGNNYVYDLETEDGTYYAGSRSKSNEDQDKDLNRSILLKNTDSCYVNFNINKDDYTIDGKFDEQKYMEENFKIAGECAHRISETFKSPVELEFEKFMYPFFLYQKKRYAYQEWTSTDGPKKKLEYKGLALKRRDSCYYVKEVCSKIFELLMQHVNEDGSRGSIDLALAYVKTAIKDLLEDKIPIQKLIISNSLKAKYKVKGVDVDWTEPLKKNGKALIDKDGLVKYDERIYNINKAHVQIAIELRKLDPLNSPTPPERVPYVFIINKKAKLQCEKVSHPDYIGLKKIDTLYYFERQLKTPLCQILGLIVKNVDDLFKDDVRHKINKMNNQLELSFFFKPVKQIEPIKLVIKPIDMDIDIDIGSDFDEDNDDLDDLELDL